MTNVGVVAWGAASTALSACLYLLDLGTTLDTLHAYYLYKYRCPHAALSSTLLRDPICRAIRSSSIFISIGFEFWACISILAIAYPLYALVFWTSLDPVKHPLRLAYFMPLIHLHRLLRVLRNSFSIKELEKLQEDQAEVNSLYNALGAAVETAPQFLIQFYIAIRLGEYVKGSENGRDMQIPRKLLLSLGASLLSASYSTAIAVVTIIEKRITLATRVCVGFAVGWQTSIALLATAICKTSLTQFNNTGYSLPLVLCIIFEVAVSWLFIGFLLQSCHGSVYQHENRCLKIAHSFGLACMIKITSPTYVTMKHGKSPRYLILGTLSHIFVELIGLALVLLWPFHPKQRNSICHSFPNKSMEVEGNKFLTCKVFLYAKTFSMLILIGTSMFLVWIEFKLIKSTRVVPIAFTTQSLCNRLENATSHHNLESINNQMLEGSKGKPLHQMSRSSFVTLFKFVVTNFLIHKLYKRYVLKIQATTYW